MTSRTEGGRVAAEMWSLFAGLALLMLGSGLQASLVGIRTQLDGFSGGVTGLVMAAYFAGFLGGSFVVPRFVATVGHIRVFAALASSASVAALLYTITGSPLAWIGMRLLTGVCLAGLYVVAESWINSRATNTTRGRLLGIYMVIVMGGMGLGQLLLNLADPAGFELFVTSSVLVSLAVVPVSLVRAPTPDVQPVRPMNPFELARMSPLGVGAGFLTGAANAAVLGMGAVYATTTGLDIRGVTAFMATSLLGGVAFQWPLGALSDRVPRRRVILGVALVATATAVMATTVHPAGGAMIALTFVYGGMMFPMYSLAVSHINDTVPHDRFVASAAAFLFVSGTGAIGGPLVVAAALRWLGADGYWWSLAAFYTPVAALAVFRLVRRRRIHEGHFTPVSPRMSPVMGQIIEGRDPGLDGP